MQCSDSYYKLELQESNIEVLFPEEPDGIDTLKHNVEEISYNIYEYYYLGKKDVSFHLVVSESINFDTTESFQSALDLFVKGFKKQSDGIIIKNKYIERWKCPGRSFMINFDEKVVYGQVFFLWNKLSGLFVISPIRNEKRKGNTFIESFEYQGSCK
jgi:hypothetical protein